MEYSIWLTGLLFFTHMKYGNYQIRAIPRYYLIAIIIFGCILLSSTLFSFNHTDTHRMHRVLKMLIILLAIHCLSKQDVHKEIDVVFMTLLILLISFQFVIRVILGRPYGTYSNLHYLAELACLTLPFFFYYCWTVPKTYKVLFIAIGILNLDILLRTLSRPGIIALAASVLFAILFLAQGRYRSIKLLIFFFATVALYLTNYADLSVYIKELIVNIASEPRVNLWTDTWKMLQHNSWRAWIIGNGIGSFPDFFPKYSISENAYLSFPHNHILQIFFDNGLIGVIAVLAWQIYLLYLLIKSSYKTTDLRLRLFINCVAVTYMTWAIFTSLTVGFYSVFSLYPFAFLSGIILTLAERVLNGVRYAFTSKPENFSFNMGNKISLKTQNADKESDLIV